MAAIKHNHVMPVLHHNLDHSPPYFTMPITVCSIEKEIRQGLSEAQALDIFKQICLGIQAIHTANGTHRDIKPENAMRMADGGVVVSDLGLVKLDPRDTTTLTQTVAFIGTRMYCAPEQLLLGGSRDADARTDVYQLGKTLYEMVTGDLPALINARKVSPGLAYIIERATQQHPEQRYQSVGALMDAVQIYVLTQTPGASPNHVFEAALQEAIALASAGQYKRENLEALLSLLLRFEDEAKTLLEQFGRIPNGLLPVIARNLSVELRPVLKAYSDAIDAVIGTYNFSYAEFVAQKMKIIFDAADDAYIKALAIRATLIAAVALNRYAAMDVFDSLLAAVERVEDAVAVAEMLRDEMSRYANLANRIPKSNLHVAIRAICEEATRDDKTC